MSTNVSLLVCFVNLVESVLILYEKYYTVTLCNLTVTLYLHKVTVRFHKVIVRFHKVTVSTNYEIELKNQYLMLDNFIICYSIKIFITLQYYIKCYVGICYIGTCHRYFVETTENLELVKTQLS